MTSVLLKALVPWKAASGSALSKAQHVEASKQPLRDKPHMLSENAHNVVLLVSSSHFTSVSLWKFLKKTLSLPAPKLWFLVSASPKGQLWQTVPNR